MKRKHTISLVIICFLLTACENANDDLKISGPSQQYTMEQFLKTTWIDGSSFSPNEDKLLVSSNETGVFQVYELDIATGERTKVTEGDDTTFPVAYMPNDGRILFTRNSGGINHLFVRQTDGTITNLTKGAETEEHFWRFSSNLKSFYTISNSGDQLFEWNIETLQKKMIYKNETGLNLSKFDVKLSPDLRWLVLFKRNTNNDSDFLVLDKNSGEPVLISEHEGEAHFVPECISFDSRFLYYVTDVDGEFLALKRYEFTTGIHEDVFSADWGVEFVNFSRLGTYRVIGTNEDGYTKIKITNTKSGEDVVIPNLPSGKISEISFSNSERLMKFTVSSDASPANIYVYDLQNGVLKQLTDTLSPEIKKSDLVTSKVARFEARDGLTISGPLYKPLGAGPEHKVPVLLWIHGGPGAQSVAGYSVDSAEKQFLLNHGYGIFAINYRGSFGYGKSFHAADDKRHGREPLWDCVDAKKYLKTLDWVDPDRIGILGLSHGGYMVLAALAFQPEEFKVGVDLCGVSNYLRILQNMPPSMQEEMYEEIGHPEKDEELLRAISPIFHADKITKPLLILHGANDTAVPQAESDDMVAAIKANGGTVEYTVFKDEGHGFTKLANRIKSWKQILKFLDTYLKDLSSPATRRQ